MKLGDSRVKEGPGINPAQDHGYVNDGRPLDQRASTLAMRIKGRIVETGRWVIESGSVGDITTWYLWGAADKSKRSIPAWRASPFLVKLKKHEKDAVSDGGAGGPGGEVPPDSRPPGDITPPGGGGGHGPTTPGGGPSAGGKYIIPPAFPPNPSDLPQYGTGGGGGGAGGGGKPPLVLYLPQKSSEPTGGDPGVEAEPILDAKGEIDDRLVSKKIARPTELNSPKFPGGWVGFVGTGSNESTQEDMFLPTDGRLIASNRGDPMYGTVVTDLDQADVDEEVQAPLQAQLRVVKKPTGKLSLEENKTNALARSIGVSQKSDALALVVDGKGKDAPHGRETVRDGGHLCIGGGPGCAHQIGTTEDGAPIFPTHLHTKAFFRDKGGKRCGPIDFEQDYPSAMVGPIVVVAGCAYEPLVPYSWPLDDGSQTANGKWRFYSYGFFGGGGGDGDDPPTTGGGGGDDGGGGTPPGEGGGSTTPGGGPIPGSGGGGDGGGGSPPGEGAGGPTSGGGNSKGDTTGGGDGGFNHLPSSFVGYDPDTGKIRWGIGPTEVTPKQSVGDSWNLNGGSIGSTQANLRVPGFVFRAQPAAAGAPDLAETVAWNPDDVRTAKRKSPAVLRVSAWSKQGADGTFVNYTREPGKGRREPTADGGIEFLPPERLPVDAATVDGSIPTTHQESESTVSLHPKVALHFGRVDRSIGAVTGWQAQAEEGGDLVFSRVDASGVATEAFRFTADGITLAGGEDMTFNTGVGTKIGTSASEKLAFHGATSVVQDTGWSVAGASTRRSITAGDSLSELIDTVGTLVTKLQEKGIIGA